MKKSFLFIGMMVGAAFFMPTKLLSQSSCPNLDFSGANFTYWQAYAGTWSSTVIMNPTVPLKDRHEIMDATTLVGSKFFDEKCTKIPKVPNGFTYAAKLGNASVGAQMEALEYTMTIDSTNALLILHFACVMEDPNHGHADQPQFSMRIKDSAGNLMNVPCGNVNFVASQTLTNLVCKTTSLVARDWTTVGFNFSALMGQTIKIYFETRDCKLTAHFGYAYLVGECRPFAIDLIFCEGNATATLEAPVGFIDYKWTRSKHPTWIKQGDAQSYQKITITDPEEGEVFTCEVTSELDSACSAILTASVTKTYIKTDFAYGIMENGGVDIVGHDTVNWYDTCSRTATFVDLSSVINGKMASVLWEIPQLNAVSNDSLFTYIFPDSANIVDYLVRLTAITENGCEHMEEKYIRIYPSPKVNISGINQMCIGDSSYLKAVAIQSQFVSHAWSWEDAQNQTQTATGDSIKIYGKGTYTVVSTNTEGCVTSDSITVIDFPTPYIEVISKTIEHCEGKNGSIQLGFANAASPVRFLWNTGDTTAKLDTLHAGTYQVTMTDGNGCRADTNIVVDVYPMPTLSANKTHETCNKENGTITLIVNSANPSSVKYIWTGLSDTIAALTGLKAGTYFVTVQDTLCFIKDTIVIEHIDIPTAGFATHSYDTCTRTAVFADQSFVTNGKKDSILWEIPQLNIASNDSLFTYTFPDPAANQPVDYLVRLTVFAENGCVDTAQQHIIIYSSPKIQIDGVDLMCVGDSSYLKAIVLKSQIMDYTWKWQDEYGNTQTAPGDSVKIYIGGTYTLTATNTEHCTAMDTITVIAAPVPYIEVTSNVWETCGDGNGIIEIIHRNALEPVRYTWNTPSQDTTNRLVMLSTGTYQVNMIDGNGCKADTSIVVGLYPTPTVEVAETPESCLAKNGAITLTVNSAMPSSVQYIWDGLPYTTPSLAGLKAGTYTVKVQDTLCFVDTSIIIETIDGLVADFEIQSYDTCTRTAVFADLSSIENGTINAVLWEIPQLDITASDSLFTYTFPDPPTNQNVEYTVRLTVTTQNNCVHTAEQSITVYPSPKIKIDGDDLMCEGDSLYLKAVPVKSQFVSHVWQRRESDNVTQIATGDFVKVYNKGVYSIVSYNTVHCAASDSTTIIEVPQPHIGVTTSTWATCEQENGAIEITLENVTYPVKTIWNTGRPQDTTNSVDKLAAGKYYVKIIDKNGCIADTNVTVELYPLPFVVDVEKLPERCNREDGEINLIVNSAVPESLIYNWEGFSNTTPKLTGLKAGIYKVSIQDSLCMIDTTITITHTPAPIANFDIDNYNVILNNPFTLTDRSFGNINVWNWDMGDGHKLNGKVVTHRYSATGDYKIVLEVIDENDCKDTVSKIIHIFKLDVYIPNIFTPNGDGINDIWKPVMNEYSTEGYQLSIFDRWGQLIFYTNDTEEGWDGTVNGNPAAPNTVYSYKLKVRDYVGLEYEFVGHISLVR